MSSDTGNTLNVTLPMITAEINGWAINVAIELVKQFHKAANMPMPEWLHIP